MANNKKQKLTQSDLKNLAVKIDLFGSMIPNIELDQVNDFLNDRVKDRKLEHLQGDLQSES